MDLNKTTLINSFEPIKKSLSKYIINLMCGIGISLDTLKDKFFKNGETDTKTYLEQLKIENKKTKKKFTSLKPIQVEAIINFFKEL